MTIIPSFWTFAEHIYLEITESCEKRVVIEFERHTASEPLWDGLYGNGKVLYMCTPRPEIHSVFFLLFSFIKQMDQEILVSEHQDLFCRLYS